ncbi:hypothetical protein FRC18_003352 [Serendipita sp. 400]|nr:hypothetical protein FRC18_003352 [Serendipita sp. 400]
MPTLDDFIFLSPRSKEAISALIMFKKRAIEFGNERIIANDRPRSAYQTDTPIPEEIWDPSIVEGSEDDGTGRQPQCCPPTTEASSDEGQCAAPSARLRRPVSTRDDNPGPLERGARDSFGSRAINTTSRKSGTYALRDDSASSSPSTDATITPSRFQGIPKVSRSSAQVPKGSPSRQQMGVYTEGAPVEEEALSEFEDTDSSLSPEPTTMPPHQAVRLVNVNDKSKFMLFEGIWFERVHGMDEYFCIV